MADMRALMHTHTHMQTHTPAYIYTHTCRRTRLLTFTHTHTHAQVRRDNPRLTTRREGGHAPVRVVMSRTLDLPEVCVAS